MNTGKSCSLSGLPAMDYLRIVDRCGDHRRPDAFLMQSIGLRPAQPTGKACAHRTCLSVHALSGLPPAAPALDAPDANERRDGVSMRRWPSGVEDAVRDEGLGLEPTRRPLCACRSFHAHFRRSGGHAARPAGLPSFIHRHGKRRLGLPEAGGHGGRGQSTLPAFMCCRRGLASTNIYWRTDRSTGIICDQPDGFYTRQDYPGFCGASASRTPSPARRWSSSPTRLPAADLRALQKPLAGGSSSSGSSRSSDLLRVGERGEDADLEPSRSTSSSPSSRSASTWTPRSTLCYDPLGDPLRAHTSSTWGDENRCSQITTN